MLARWSLEESIRTALQLPCLFTARSSGMASYVKLFASSSSSICRRRAAFLLDSRSECSGPARWQDSANRGLLHNVNPRPRPGQSELVATLSKHGLVSISMLRHRQDFTIDFDSCYCLVFWVTRCSAQPRSPFQSRIHLVREMHH